jgi:hypothetical protein
MTMLTKEEFVKTHPDIRVGMTVYSMDDEKLGVIERVDEDNFTVERGWFFHKDFMIPYDDIEEIREDRVLVRQRREDLEEQRVEEGRMREESEFTGRAAGIGGYERGREEVGMETEHLEVPVQKEDVIVERAPAEETWTSVAGEKAFEEEEIRIPEKEEEVEPNKPAQKK